MLHGTMPTVVYPNAMRPRGLAQLALLESPDVVDLWIQEKDEAESQSVNHTMLSGGAFGKILKAFPPGKLQRAFS